jgi:hypothetical protein
MGEDEQENNGTALDEHDYNEDDALLDDTDDPDLAAEPVLRYELLHQLTVEHNPEALLFVPPTPIPDPSPASAATPASPGVPPDPHGYLLYTTRASHLLHYLALSTLLPLSKSFNAHPLDDHVSFSVLNLALHPSGNVVACQTDHAGAGERVVLYSTDPNDVSWMSIYTRMHACEHARTRTLTPSPSA